MKDIVIKGTTLRRELLLFALCLVAAFMVNVYAVVHYDRPAVELFSQLGFVVVIACVLYIVLALVRAAVLLLALPFRRKK